MELPWIALSFLVVIALERTRLRRLAAPLVRAHFAADFTFFATGVVALGLGMRWLAERGATALAAAPLAAWPALASFTLTLALYDLGAWGSHWLMHRVPCLWRVHKVHHASPQLDWLAAFRMHPIEHAIRHGLSPVVLLLAGFPPLHVAIASILAGGWAALAHANLHVRWDALEWLLVTPRVHHVHHAPQTSDRNLGAIFSVWDRLAGRLTRASAARDALLGVPGEERSYPHGWWAQVREPFRSSASSTSPNRSPRSQLRPQQAQ